MKNQFNIRHFTTLNLIAIALVLMASCENELTDETDITKSAWRVQFIEVDNIKLILLIKMRMVIKLKALPIF